jgi:mono/diheme cytochrome c family protein
MSLVDIVSSNKFAQWTAASIIVTAAALLLSRDAAAQDTSSGQRLFQDKADCQFCHGIDGDGRGAPQSPGRRRILCNR